MNNTSSNDLEALWDGLLSQEPERIRASFAGLTSGERQAVLAHLKEMAGGEGWHPAQRAAAQSALEALDQV